MHWAIYIQLIIRYTSSRLFSTYFFVRVLLVIVLDAFVQQRIQANQEQHVDDQQRYHPNHNDDHEFDDARITILVLAFAAWTKFLFFGLDFTADAWQDHSITITAERSKRKAGEFRSSDGIGFNFPKIYHLDGGTFSIIKYRSVSSVLLPSTELRLGQIHLHLLSSYDCACRGMTENKID